MMYKDKFVVAVKSEDGRILREDGDIVYIPFSEHYSLQFKNLQSNKAVITIEIDGKDVLNNNQLIINPNQSVSLERFVDDLNSGRKFKFIQKTDDIQNHRGDKIDDGFIRITFQFEKPKQEYPTLFYPSNTILRSHDATYYNDTLTSNSSSTTTVGQNSSTNYAVLDSISDLSNTSYTLDSSSPKLEEGITVQGSKSNQSFRLGNIGSLEQEKHVMIFRLKGFTKNGNEVTEALTVNSKLTCSSCGKTSDSSSEFCNKCGTALAI